MTTTCRQAIRSLRTCAWINLKQAKQAKAAGQLILANYHATAALECRRDANALRDTSRTNPPQA